MNESQSFSFLQLFTGRARRAVDLAREEATRLNSDPSMVSRFCAGYEAVRDLKTEKKIAEVIDK